MPAGMWSIDHNEAIKTIKRKITDLDRMKIEEQKKAIRSGYDMDIIPSDLATYGGEAKNLLRDLQSRNERMFLLTLLAPVAARRFTRARKTTTVPTGLAALSCGKMTCSFSSAKRLSQRRLPPPF